MATGAAPIRLALVLDGEGASPLDDVHDLVADLESGPVEHLEVRQAPPDAGAKGLGVPIDLLVDVLPAAVPSLVVLLQGWLLRHRDQKVRVKVGDAEVELPADADPDVALAVAERLAELGTGRSGR